MSEMPFSASQAVRELTVQPAAFWAFHQQYYLTYRSYAELQLGAPPEAEELVDKVFVRLAVQWHALLQEESPAAVAWSLLKTSVAERLILTERQPAMPQTATFHRVTRTLLESYRAKFAMLESSLGLYTAISRLPCRQFDVIVLQYVLGHPTRHTASIMGVTEATVRSHRRLARTALARELDLDTEGARDLQDTEDISDTEGDSSL
jgi:RNA polymerase sigma-70 factor (ECF subfamily)